ncbi:MAG: 2Fe-2S iron-sulfur cluster-binding protein [Bdellovibrionales bacterium]
MPKIKFSKRNRDDIEVSSGTNLRQALLDNGIPVASSCSGEMVCAKCWVQVTDGDYNMSPLSQNERDFIEIKGLEKNTRISCVCLIEGDIEIDTPYW